MANVDLDFLTPDVIARFWAKVKRAAGDQCWEWTAAKAHFGHGQFWCHWRGARGTMVEASRIAWLIQEGEIPEGKCVLHHCDNPGCVRVSHLYIGTKKDNAADRKARGRHWKDRDWDAFKANQLNASILGVAATKRSLNVN